MDATKKSSLNGIENEEISPELVKRLRTRKSTSLRRDTSKNDSVQTRSRSSTTRDMRKSNHDVASNGLDATITPVKVILSRMDGEWLSKTPVKSENCNSLETVSHNTPRISSLRKSSRKSLLSILVR